MTGRSRWLRPGLRCAGWIAATGVVVAVLAAASARARIAPIVIADNTCVFLAADRLYEGLGFTAPLPRVPTQAWDWRCDWAFLSQWPMGYPLILCAARMVLGVETARAAVAVSVFCCGVALVGWFALVRRCLPKRWPALWIAVLAAASTLSLSNLVYPSSDTVLLALVPLVLLLAWWARVLDDVGTDSRVAHGFSRGENESADHSCPPPLKRRATRPPPLKRWATRPPPLKRWATRRLALFGLLAGALVWIRYAAIFVPLGIGVFLVGEWLWGRRARFGQVAVYGLAAMTPILALAVVNHSMSEGVSMQQRYPVGDRLSLDLRLDPFATAWHLFTAQTFYDHRPESKWFFAAAVPLAGVFLPLAFRDSRRWMTRFLSSPPVRLCGATMVTCLLMLIGLSVFFKYRFDYAGLARYYVPIKPFYFLFFVSGMLAFRPWALRVLACVPLVLACSWTVNQDWARSWGRELVRQHDVTPYGRRAVYFEPNSADLYEWLRSQKSDDLLVLSNFHDDIALETWIPACPTPASVAQMHLWVERVKKVRGVSNVRVLFVLDPDNHCRRYFLPPPEELVERFDLTHVAGVPGRVVRYVYSPGPYRQLVSCFRNTFPPR